MTDVEREILRRARDRKNGRRFAAYLSGLDGYHPRFKGAFGGGDLPRWVERVWGAMFDDGDLA